MRVVAAAIDCGFKDALVLRFTRERYARRVYAVKGRPGQTPIWPRKPSRKNLDSVLHGPHRFAAKTAVYDQLKIQEPGPSYHVTSPSDARLDYFEQLTAAEEVRTLSATSTEARAVTEGRRREERGVGLSSVRLRGAVCAVCERAASGCALRQVRADGRWSTR